LKRKVRKRKKYPTDSIVSTPTSFSEKWQLRGKKLHFILLPKETTWEKESKKFVFLLTGHQESTDTQLGLFREKSGYDFHFA